MKKKDYEVINKIICSECYNFKDIKLEKPTLDYFKKFFEEYYYLIGEGLLGYAEMEKQKKLLRKLLELFPNLPTKLAEYINNCINNSKIKDINCADDYTNFEVNLGILAGVILKLQACMEQNNVE